MTASARILHQLLQTDRLLGVEAVPRTQFPQPETARVQVAPPPAVRSAPAPQPKAQVAPSVPPAPLRPPVVVSAAAASAAWQTTLEMPLAPAGAGEALAVLFVSIEWGSPLTGEIRALFDRQVAAMKLVPAQAGLLRMAWSGADEPPAAALVQARARAQEAAGQGLPRAVVLFGGFSIRAVGAQLGSSLMSARGRWFDWEVDGRVIPTCATWHPSQLGLDRDRRAQTWEDLKGVCAKLGM